MPKPSEIKNEKLRALVSQAQAAIRSGDYTGSVKHSSEAVRQLFILRPEALAERAAMGGRYLPPNVGVRLVIEGVPEPTVIFDREKFVMAEALTWYQYALENIVAGEPQV